MNPRRPAIVAALLALSALTAGCDKKDGDTKGSTSSTPTSSAATAPAATTAAATTAAAGGGDSKYLKAAMADRKCRKPDETEADIKFKAPAGAAEFEKMKLSDAVLDCFIACKTKDDAEKCQKLAMKK